MPGKVVDTVRISENRMVLILRYRTTDIRAQQQKVRTCCLAHIYHPSVVTRRCRELFGVVVKLCQLQVDRCLIRVCTDKRALEAFDSFQRSARA